MNNKRERDAAGGGWAAIRRPGFSLSLLRSNEASVVMSLVEPTLGEILPANGIFMGGPDEAGGLLANCSCVGSSHSIIRLVASEEGYFWSMAERKGWDAYGNGRMDF